jgi:hypothetical protein
MNVLNRNLQALFVETIFGATSWHKQGMQGMTGKQAG